MLSLVTLFYILLIISVLLYLYSKWKYNYFKRIGLDCPQPEFFFGNIKPIVKQEICYGYLFDKFYKNFKSKNLSCGGYYNLFTPVFMPVSLEMVKCILHKDFPYFPNHGTYVNEKKDPLTGNLFFLENEKWKKLRQKLTPTFSSGKIKIMFSTVEECANPILKILNNEDNIKDGVDIKELMLRYAKDVIGAAAFGVDCNTLEDPNSSFNKHTNGFFKVNFLRLVNIGMGLLLSRDILQKIGYRFTPKYIEDFFLNLVKQTIEHRENNNIMRKDFLQILMELKNNKQNLLGESKEDEDTDFGINNIAANVFLFFVAGVETTANTTSFALMELAINQDIQDKVRSEIHTVLNKYNGKLSYEAVNEMEYLEQVILETLRKHPTAQKMHRQCIKPYKVPGTDIMLEAGTRVVVPVWSIHMDPEYYPNPEKFDPDRFSLQNKAKLDSGCFLGFGDGPRYCIGVRMGKLQTKIAIIKIIQNFRVTLNEKLKQPIQYGFSIVGAAIKGGIWLDVEKI